ncbi:beta-galactosidase domain 4-containing protein [Streptomyces chiangmaiensis]
MAFEWAYQVDGETVESGMLPVPALAPGESADVKLPEPPDTGSGETQWTVRALLATDTAWGPKGHQVAWGQFPVSAPPPVHVAQREAPRLGDGRITLGPASFDSRTGALMSVGAVDVAGLRLDVWRAPTDNDDGAPWQPDLRYGLLWRKLGLHRMRHRLDAVELTGDALTVRTRVAPAARQVGLATVYRWTSDGERLRVTVSVSPEGDWTVPLPRLGVRFGLSGAAARVRWFGGGPGEAYPDTRSASELGRWESTVDELGTPYVRPQENGARADVRWAELGGLRIEGEPEFWFSARRWTNEQLDDARHLTDLVPGETVWVNLDHGQHGIGSQSCGPGPLPQYFLRAEPTEFSFVFSEIS